MEDGERYPAEGRDVGHAPHVVLLHGLGADHRAFQRFVRLLPVHWDRTTLDLLGHGHAPHPARGYSLADHADHVARRITELMGERHVVLVGHSYGAATSVACAARHPNLVRGIVLLDAVVSLDEREGVQQDEGVLASSMHPARVDSNTWRERSVDPTGHRETATQQMIRARREGRMAETVARLFAGESPALQKWVVETWEQMAVGVVDELDGDWPRFAPQVSCPVAVIHGDPALGGGGAAPAAYFPHATVTRIANAGHYLHATHARETAEAVVRAVDAIDASTGVTA